MAKPFKVDELLSRGELDAMEDWLRERRRTVDETHEYVQALGYTISRRATAYWLSEWREREQMARIRESSGAAARLARAIEESSPGDLTGAAAQQLSQRIFETLVAAEEALGPGDLMKLGVALKGGAASELAAQKVRIEERKRQQEAVKEASKVAAKGGDASAVLDTIKQALGIVSSEPEAA